MQYTWQLIHKSPIENVGQNATPKQTIVLEELKDSEYPSSIVVDIRKDKIEQLDGTEVWSIVTAQLNTKAREYNGRRYNGISAWSIKVDEQVSIVDPDWDVDDDLPF